MNKDTPAVTITISAELITPVSVLELKLAWKAVETAEPDETVAVLREVVSRAIVSARLRSPAQ